MLDAENPAFKPCVIGKGKGKGVKGAVPPVPKAAIVAGAGKAGPAKAGAAHPTPATRDKRARSGEKGVRHRSVEIARVRLL